MAAAAGLGKRAAYFFSFSCLASTGQMAWSSESWHLTSGKASAAFLMMTCLCAVQGLPDQQVSRLRSTAQTHFHGWLAFSDVVLFVVSILFLFPSFFFFFLLFAFPLFSFFSSSSFFFFLFSFFLSFFSFFFVSFFFVSFTRSFSRFMQRDNSLPSLGRFDAGARKGGAVYSAIGYICARNELNFLNDANHRW